MRLSALIATTALGLLACAQSPPQPTTARAIAVTANPDATQAAMRMLDQGGSAVDAAVAAQMVLGLVEPQSSGIGGGALAMHWDAARRQLSSYDGLAAAPARVTAALGIDADGRKLDALSVRRGGRSVGVPGALGLLEALHQQHGRLAWAALFKPAIDLAEAGFAMPRYLHAVLAAPNAAAEHPELRALYFDADGLVLPVGKRIKNPAYAQTLRSVAALGVQGWLRGGAARDIAAAAQRGALPSFMTEADVLAHRTQPREPLCGPFLRYRVCAMGPASFGGVAVLQMLQMLQPAASSASAAAAALDFDDAEFVHRYVEAGRLAQADRLRFVGDPDSVPVPTAQLLAPAYLQQRAALINPARAMPEARAGDLAVAPVAPRAAAQNVGEHADVTSQITIVDAAGNALAITTTINLNFGSRLMVGGFVLNNALTNFADSAVPGPARANQMAPNKRPVTSMAPIIVFDPSGEPVVVGGSAGGGQIVDYIAQSLLEMLAAQRTPAQALARGHVSTANAGVVQLEAGTAAALHAPALRDKGHKVEVSDMKSGLAFVKRDGARWIGAADPRRDGTSLGR